MLCGKRKMNVLVYGSGAREHIIAKKISQSKFLSRLFLANPNEGFKDLGEVVKFCDFYDLAKKCNEYKIDLAIIGPEEPLSNGIVDILNSYGISTIGANKHFSTLESSKIFAKKFMKKYNIPTSHFEIINSKEDIDTKFVEFIKKYNQTKIVLKADGLCKGKGVFICDDVEVAKEKLKTLLNGEFGEASKKVLVEQYQKGDEISLISLFDGKTLLPFLYSQDYKRLYENNLGPNTGGMGAYCPVIVEDKYKNQIDEYLKKLQEALISEKADFIGFIYSGLILTYNGIKVLEYNMRLGDPETQALLTSLKTDFLKILIYAKNKNLDKIKLKWNDKKSYCLVVSSKGYPQQPIIGDEILNLKELKQKYKNVDVYFANVKKKEDKLLSNGGRVLSLCSFNKNDIYKFVNELIFKNKYYRKDLFKVEA